MEAGSPGISGLLAPHHQSVARMAARPLWNPSALACKVSPYSTVQVCTSSRRQLVHCSQARKRRISQSDFASSLSKFQLCNAPDILLHCHKYHLHKRAPTNRLQQPACAGVRAVCEAFLAARRLGNLPPLEANQSTSLWVHPHPLPNAGSPAAFSCVLHCAEPASRLA